MCPCCYARLNASSPINTIGKPDPGDVTVCAYCGCALQFDEHRRLIWVTPAEMEAMRAKDPGAWDDLKRAQVKVLVKIVDQRETKKKKALLN